MITAQEAKSIVTTSRGRVDMYMAEIEYQIRNAAEAGQSSVAFHPKIANEELSKARDHAPKQSALQNLLIEKLVGCGFNAKVQANGDEYVPRSLADEDGNGPRYRNYSIVIRW